jgi:hypothetical protein
MNLKLVSGAGAGNLPGFSGLGWSYYARLLPEQTSWVVVALAAVSFVAGLANRSWWGEGESFFTAWLISGYVFFSLIALKDPRYTVFILLPIAFLAVRPLLRAAPQRVGGVVAVALAALSLGYTLWRFPAPYVDGYAQAVDYVAARAPRGSVILFSGYRDGAFIFDMRRRVDRPDLWVLRSDKLLLRVAQRRDFGLEQLNVSVDETADMMNRFGVSYVVSQPNFWDDLRNMRQLQDVLQSGQFRKVAVIPVTSNVPHDDRELEIYQNLGLSKAARKERIRLDLPIVGMQVEGVIDNSDGKSSGGSQSPK